MKRNRFTFNKHFMLIEDFDFEINYQKAYQRAVEMVNNELYSRFGLTRKSRIEKAQLGCMGEIAFEQLLIAKEYPYEIDRTHYKERNSDEFDFLINGKKLDTKVAKKSTSNAPNDSWTYGYPTQQHPLSKDFVVIGWVDLINKGVGFYGWITGESVHRCEVVNVNTYKGYKYLTPNHEFKWGVLNKNFDQLFEKIFDYKL